MRHDIEKYERIERYLKGELSGKELKQIQYQINTDSEFALEVQSQQAIFNFIEENSFLEIKDKIRDIHNQHLNNPAKKGFSRGTINIIIGGLILTGIVMVSIYINKNKVANNSTVIRPNATISIEESKEIIDTNFKPNTIRDEKVISITKRIVTSNQSHSKNSQKPMSTGSGSQQASNYQKLAASPITDTNLSNADKKLNGFTFADNQPKPIRKPTLKGKTPLSSELPKNDSFNCVNFVINADVRTESSCFNKPTGKLIIDQNSITGGTPPYTCSVDDAQNYYSKFLFENLNAAIYSISIRDKNGCLTKLGNFVINSIDCTYKYAFAPDAGEDWLIPTQEKTGNIKIFNKFGRIIYKEIFDFPGTYKWFGRTNTGEELPMGAYMFILELEEKETLYGNVTIVR